MRDGIPSTAQAAVDDRGAVRLVNRSAVLYVAASSRERAWSRDRLLRIGSGANVATNLTDVLQQLRSRHFNLCLVDLADDRAALSVIRVIRAQHPDVPVVGIIDSAYPFMAADAIQAGVVDLLPWPFEERDVAVLLANEAERTGQSGPARADLDEDLRTSLIAHSPGMRQVVESVRTAAAGHRGVLVSGEPGTGRETVARAIHRLDPVRATGKFVVVDCAALGPIELERRLFGAPTERPEAQRQVGAVRVGPDSAVIEAQQGSLFLRHMVEAPVRVQAQLARLLRDREVIVHKGGSVEIDSRAMASVDLTVAEAVADGRLRRDLYERFAQERIDVPPLRRRREDLPQMTMFLVRQLCARLGRERTVSRSAMALLAALPYPGNARELLGLLEKIIVGGTQPVIQTDEVLAHVSLDAMAVRVEDGLTLRDARARFERDCISAVLTKHHGRMGEAAKALGIQRTNLYRKVRQLKVARLVASRR